MNAFKSKTTTVQTLLFPRAFWNSRDASSWARKHGFISSKVHVTDEHIRIRQQEPEQFQENSFRTIQLKGGTKPVSAVIGRPWVLVGNPRCVLFELIHSDWKLHKRKHDLFAQLARLKGKGDYDKEKASRKLKPLAMEAAKLYRRQHKIKPRLAVVFPPEKINRAIDALRKQFVEYWAKGQLDQYIDKKNWSKRQEPKSLSKPKKHHSSHIRVKKGKHVPKSDVVWYWVGGTKAGKWNRADPGTRDKLRRSGYVAHDGLLSIGPPEGPPKAKEINQVLTANLPEGLAKRIQRQLNKKYS